MRLNRIEWWISWGSVVPGLNIISRSNLSTHPSLRISVVPFVHPKKLAHSFFCTFSTRPQGRPGDKERQQKTGTDPNAWTPYFLEKRWNHLWLLAVDITLLLVQSPSHRFEEEHSLRMITVFDEVWSWFSETYDICVIWNEEDKLQQLLRLYRFASGVKTTAR